jgi:hypothetical protein
MAVELRNPYLSYNGTFLLTYFPKQRPSFSGGHHARMAYELITNATATEVLIDRHHFQVPSQHVAHTMVLIVECLDSLVTKFAAPSTITSPAGDIC